VTATALASSRMLSEQDISRVPSYGTPSPRSLGTLSDREIQRPVSEASFMSRVPATYPDVRGQLQPFLNLAPNWDSYGGRPIDPTIIDVAQYLLVSISESELELPSLVPTSLGGLSLEWHRPTVEFAIELEPEGGIGQLRAVVFFSDDVSGEQWEEDLSQLEPAQLQRALSQFH